MGRLKSVSDWPAKARRDDIAIKSHNLESPMHYALPVAIQKYFLQNEKEVSVGVL